MSNLKGSNSMEQNQALDRAAARNPAANPASVPQKALAAKQRADVYAMHTHIVGRHVYGQMLGEYCKSEDLDGTAVRYITDLIDSVKPRDAIEQMLVMQALWTHTRLGRLSILANQQTGTNNLKVVNEAADRAANTFRRQMLALAEYREPRKGDTFMAIKQANMAQQQVVQNGENRKSDLPGGSNEKGSPSGAAAGIKALSAHAAGPGIPSGIHREREAVEVNARPAHGGGQGTGEDERAEARRSYR
jgi:hypothetical protein